MYVKDIKTPNKLFKFFLSILITVYLNYFFNLLKELELNDDQTTFFRPQIWSYTGSLKYDFCLNVNIEQFNVLFNNMKYPEHYNSNCYKITNKYFVVDLT